MKPTNSLFANTGVTVFETMTRLAIETGAINLGQGFPDDLGPENLRRAVTRRSAGYCGGAKSVTRSHDRRAEGYRFCNLAD